MSHTNSNFYLKILLILGALTTLTVVLARNVTFSPSVSIIVALLIASVKATLVILYFMHMKHENKLLWIYAIFPVVILLILVGGLFIDDPFRDVSVPVKVVEVK